MVEPESPLKDQRSERGRFQPGRSGNPAGKPAGTRHAALVALDAIGQENAAAVLQSVVEAAQTGDMRAAEILLRRAWPERKGRPLQFDLPPMETAGDLVKAMSAISGAMASGTLTTEEAAAAASVLEAHRRAIDTQDLAARVAALEAGQSGKETSQ